ncbi:S66 family peptidase [Lutispora thermophila]|uniref:Muramoyltetrapeptide carboxypeptidase LdcA (Peptidoglycan recycling) n=1 Tax=Lutispora thermophila DSM 19022 TaxID=1122184 RepID=A0A1M6E4E4_9FIRM|nr:S66 peptidase family protein [Lutispora thermophila]SHI80372.1 Muramoyltetrapeptide carboxypeptidase LdcA (peptidoglycan recycling) [Lutispora thermophila DSM 19022]
MKRLKVGDAIGIFSPSSPITYTVPKRFHRAKAYLEAKGFEIIEGALTGKHDYYRSGTIKERADELNQLIRNPEVKCIMSTIGGMNSNSILPYIDYEAFRENPKIIIGYSDVTAILLGIYAKTGISTFYGPALVASFGEFPPFVDYTYEYFKDMLTEDVPLPYEFPIPEYWTDEYIDWSQQDREKEKRENQWITVCEGVTRGRLIGGNLNTMMGIWGSQYMPEIKEGDILFIEDSLKDAATIERSFSLLKINGVFDKVSGIILGKHELFNDMGTGRKPYEILLEVLGERQLPFIADFDCCHTHPMLTLPIGVEVELDATNKKVRMLSGVFDDSTL